MAIDDSSAPPPLRIGLPSRLGEMLVRHGLVSADDVHAALAEQAAGSEWRLGRLLVRRGALDDRTLVQAIAHQFHVPVVDLRLEAPSPDALGRLAASAALRLQALPLRLDADALVVAVADPPVRELRVAIERCTGLPVRLVLAAADDLAAALARDYAGADGPPAAASDLQTVVWLLSEAVRRDATAIHLDHSSAGLRIRYRVDGALQAGPAMPESSGTVVCHRLLATADLAPADDGLHEGAFDTVVDGRSITCRVTAVASAVGTHVVVRIEAATRVGCLDDLGIAATDASALRAFLHEGRGVLVVASALPAAARDVAGTLVDEIGPDGHVVVGALHHGGEHLRGAVLLDPAADGSAADGVVAAACALGAEVLVTDADDPDARRAAFAAASELLVVLCTAGDDPSDVVAALVADVGASLVAGRLRAVLVAGSEPGLPLTDVHVVTEAVCRAILDRPGAG